MKNQPTMILHRSVALALSELKPNTLILDMDCGDGALLVKIIEAKAAKAGVVFAEDMNVHKFVDALEILETTRGVAFSEADYDATINVICELVKCEELFEFVKVFTTTAYPAMNSHEFVIFG